MKPVWADLSNWMGVQLSFRRFLGDGPWHIVWSQTVTVIASHTEPVRELLGDDIHKRTWGR